MPSLVVVSQNCRKIEFAFKWQRTHAKSLSSNYPPTHTLNILKDPLSYELSAERELHCEGSPFTGERAGTILAPTSPPTAELKEVDAVARARLPSMLRKMTQLRPRPSVKKWPFIRGQSLQTDQKRGQGFQALVQVSRAKTVAAM